MGAVDFDDLLLLPLRLFARTPSSCRPTGTLPLSARRPSTRTPTNAKLQLLELPAGLRRNLCVVGDDDQSIYACAARRCATSSSFDRRFRAASRSSSSRTTAPAATSSTPPTPSSARTLAQGEAPVDTTRRGPNLRIVAAPPTSWRRITSRRDHRVSYEERSRRGRSPCSTDQRPGAADGGGAAARRRALPGGGRTSLFDARRCATCSPTCARREPGATRSRSCASSTCRRGASATRRWRGRRSWRGSGSAGVGGLLAAAAGAGGGADRTVRPGRAEVRRAPDPPGFSEAARELVEEVGLFEEARNPRRACRRRPAHRGDRISSASSSSREREEQPAGRARHRRRRR